MLPKADLRVWIWLNVTVNRSITGYKHRAGYGSITGYTHRAGYGSITRYRYRAGCGSITRYEHSAGYRSITRYKHRAGYGSITGYKHRAVYGSITRYGHRAGYGSITRYKHRSGSLPWSESDPDQQPPPLKVSWRETDQDSIFMTRVADQVISGSESGFLEQVEFGSGSGVQNKVLIRTRFSKYGRIRTSK